MIGRSRDASRASRAPGADLLREERMFIVYRRYALGFSGTSPVVSKVHMGTVGKQSCNYCKCQSLCVVVLNPT